MDKVSFLFLLLALIAEILGTIGGFGSSVFFVPLANFYFDFETVLGLTAVFHVFSNLSKIAQFRKGLDKKLIGQVCDHYISRNSTRCIPCLTKWLIPNQKGLQNKRRKIPSCHWWCVIRSLCRTIRHRRSCKRFDYGSI